VRAVQVTLHGSAGMQLSVHLKNTLEVLFLSDLFHHGQNFTLYRAEVHLEQDRSSIVQIKKLLLDGFYFKQIRSSFGHTEKFSCM
jgi:hypothetical protein